MVLGVFKRLCCREWTREGDSIDRLPIAIDVHLEPLFSHVGFFLVDASSSVVIANDHSPHLDNGMKPILQLHHKAAHLAAVGVEPEAAAHAMLVWRRERRLVIVRIGGHELASRDALSPRGAGELHVVDEVGEVVGRRNFHGLQVEAESLDV